MLVRSLPTQIPQINSNRRVCFSTLHRSSSNKQTDQRKNKETKANAEKKPCAHRTHTLTSLTVRHLIFRLYKWRCNTFVVFFLHGYHRMGKRLHFSVNIMMSLAICMGSVQFQFYFHFFHTEWLSKHKANPSSKRNGIAMHWTPIGNAIDLKL